MQAFISYSHKDRNYRDRLIVHLANLRREGAINDWHDNEIRAGDSFDKVITDNLERAEVYILIVTPDFLASNYCYDKEMQFAIARHTEGKARVIPIIAEPCDWRSTVLKDLKVVPTDGKPISEWSNENTAFLNIVQELRALFKDSAEIKPETQPSREDLAKTEKYKVRQDFDDIDKREFAERSFQEIKRYFQSSCEELSTIDGIKAKFVEYGPTMFGATVVNKAKERSIAHITFHLGRGFASMGDVYYSFSEAADRNVANGGFRVSHDQFELYLERSVLGFRAKEGRVAPAEAAAQVWVEFIGHAGVEYA